MRFDITVLALVALITPSVLPKSWDVNVVNGQFSPQELDIAPGDTVVWPNNDGADHAIVETNAGARTCNSKAGGFNSGRKAKGQAYSRTFPAAAVVNYKDGIGTNCANGATGTIYVGPRPAGPDPNAGKTSTGGVTNTGGVPSPTQTGTPVTNPTPTQRPNSAYGLSASENALFLGAVCFIGALAGL
ncbi:hypothetical protein BGZ95_009153 [Linnemannia exigua]|uniref:Blue (type 1) copper domain-containing protein n=1 Tax=Linnemannia exigua TaxID=604196 RepID=A0AAD4DM67_9FUNG|nr:hypothetical protein BGZ95_009153 [Linnemannia exigua]